MNLDRVFAQVTGDQLKAVLLTLAPRLEGFSVDEIGRLCADVVALKADDDVLIEPTISFQGAALPFVVDVFKDVDGALEVVFMLPPVLTSLVQYAACAVVGAAAVRSIVAEPTADSES
jgi:hypothetical protein